MSIGILDYGMANLRSVQKALQAVGHGADIISHPEQIDACTRLVLPGVGAMKDAVRKIRQDGLEEAIRRHIASGKPFLGICLGLQMLADVGFEDGRHPGLGIIAGEVVRFDVDARLGLKVPHMGWNSLRVHRDCPLFRGLSADSQVYFVHSYHLVPQDVGVIGSTTEYGGEFVSSLWRDNVFATQFHPEKSQRVGLEILANFAAL